MFWKPMPSAMSVRLRWAWSRSATQAAAGCQALREDVAGRADGLRQHRHPQGQRKLPAHPAVRRVNFTGRTRVGELITPPAPGTRLEGVRIPSRGSPISNRPKVAYVWLKVGTAGSRDVLDIAAGNGAHVANGIGGLGRSTDGLVWRSAGTSSAAAGRCQDRGDPGRGRSGWHPIHRARSWSLAAVSDGGPRATYTSAGGVNWKGSDVDVFRARSSSVAFANDAFVAVGGAAKPSTAPIA
ncbi:MAG: hypothetical protein ACK50F_00670 [Betaproteobacteria bacterium]